MGKQKRGKTVKARPEPVNATNWNDVARDLYEQGKISIHAIEGAYGYGLDRERKDQLR